MSAFARAAAVALAAVLALIWLLRPAPTELRQSFIQPGDAVYSTIEGSEEACRVSYDGFIWYVVGPGRFPPVVARLVSCPAGARPRAERETIVPEWAKPNGQTKTLFAFVSFDEVVSRAGTQRLAALAHRYGIPVTWVTGQPLNFDAMSDLYDSYHARFGDDLQTRPTNHNPYARASPTPTHFAELARRKFTWFSPSVAIEGSGYARDIAADMADDYRAFWGIAWNSHGVDGDEDEGAPWGAYCADPQSAKRPSPNGSCELVALEWTARDLTRAAVTDREDRYSTDPDDLQAAGFDARSGAAYARGLVDAYAAAGDAAPVAMIVQQEADQMERPPRGSNLVTSAAILDAIFSQARADGLRTLTLAQVAREATGFADGRRAIAFPYIPVLATRRARWDAWFPGGPYPATIDYHDPQVGMSFVEGRTTPVRVFPYARAGRWPELLTLPRLQRSEMPELGGADIINGDLTLHFKTRFAVRYGVALWSDPAKVHWSARHADITPAGRAGVVAAFDLPRGQSDVVLHCTGCSSLTLPLAP